jgi:hypothetical protein
LHQQCSQDSPTGRSTLAQVLQFGSQWDKVSQFPRAFNCIAKVVATDFRGFYLCDFGN